MATATPTNRAILDHDDVVVLPGIGWDDFEAIVRMKGDRRRPRLLYTEGSLTLMSPGQVHAEGAGRCDAMVMQVCTELDIPGKPLGATLFRRKNLDRGIEGDKVYYITREPEIRGKTIDLNVDPPPDLAIEVENTRPARQAVEVWRALGVPEVWVFNLRVPKLTLLHLGADGRYVEAPASRALPFLQATEILGWLLQDEDEPESRWQRRLREWVRDDLTPRLDGGVG